MLRQGEWHDDYKNLDFNFTNKRIVHEKCVIVFFIFVHKEL